MSAHIEGIVADKAKDTLVLDAGGVGFELTVSASTLSASPAAGEKPSFLALICSMGRTGAPSAVL